MFPKLKITIEKNTSEPFFIAKKQYQNWANLVFEYIKNTLPLYDNIKYYEIHLAIISSSEIHNLNKTYRQIDKPTNVLSFQYFDKIANDDFLAIQQKTSKTIFLGDIFIAPDIVLKEALEQDIPYKIYIKKLLIHGVLHLLGYDHLKDEDAEVMENLEAKLMKFIK